jgi:hypothetical protein
MSERKVEKGIAVTYHDGTIENVASCRSWWVWERVLFTNVAYAAPLDVGYTIVRGPSFPLASLRKWEENR